MNLNPDTFETYAFLFIVTCFGAFFTLLIMWLVVGCYNTYNLNNNIARWMIEGKKEEDSNNNNNI